MLISTQIHKFIYYKYLYFKISEFDSRSWQDVLDTTLCDFLLPLKEKFEDAKKSIRNRKSKKGRQYNDQKTQGKTMLNQKSRYEHPPTHNQLPGVQSTKVVHMYISEYKLSNYIATTAIKISGGIRMSIVFVLNHMQYIKNLFIVFQKQCQDVYLRGPPGGTKCRCDIESFSPHSHPPPRKNGYIAIFPPYLDRLCLPMIYYRRSCLFL